MDGFKSHVDYFIDEVLIEWIIRSDVEKAIDNIHDMCYRVREFIRRINRGF